MFTSVSFTYASNPHLVLVITRLIRIRASVTLVSKVIKTNLYVSIGDGRRGIPKLSGKTWGVNGDFQEDRRGSMGKPRQQGISDVKDSITIYRAPESELICGARETRQARKGLACWTIARSWLLKQLYGSASWLR